MTTALQSAKNKLAELEIRQASLFRRIERGDLGERGYVLRDIDIVEREIDTAKATIAECERHEASLAELAS